MECPATTIPLPDVEASLIITRSIPWRDSELETIIELGGSKIDSPDINRLINTESIAYRIPLISPPKQLLPLFTKDGVPIIRIEDGSYVAPNTAHCGLLLAESPRGQISDEVRLQAFLSDPRQFPTEYQQLLGSLRAISASASDYEVVMLSIGSNSTAISETPPFYAQNPPWWRDLTEAAKKKCAVLHIDHFNADTVFQDELQVSPPSFDPDVQKQLRDEFSKESTEVVSVEVGTVTHQFHRMYLPNTMSNRLAEQTAVSFFYEKLEHEINRLIENKIKVIVQNAAIFSLTDEIRRTYGTDIDRYVNLNWGRFPSAQEMIQRLSAKHPLTQLPSTVDGDDAPMYHGMFAHTRVYNGKAIGIPSAQIFTEISLGSFLPWASFDRIDIFSQEDADDEGDQTLIGQLLVLNV